MEENAFRNLLDYLRRHRFTSDLHSAVLDFKSGKRAFICAQIDRTFWITIPDEKKYITCKTINEVYEFLNYPEDLVTNYSI